MNLLLRNEYIHMCDRTSCRKRSVRTSCPKSYFKCVKQSNVNDDDGKCLGSMHTKCVSVFRSATLSTFPAFVRPLSHQHPFSESFRLERELRRLIKKNLRNSGEAPNAAIIDVG